MANDGQTRTRSQRVAALDLPPNRLMRTLIRIRQRDVLGRLGVCFIGALAAWSLARGWEPPFAYRVGDCPAFDIVARVEFEQPPDGLLDSGATWRVGEELADAGVPLTADKVELLALEHATYVSGRETWDRISRSVAFVMVFLALCAAVGYYLRRHDRARIMPVYQLTGLMTMIVATIGLSDFLSHDPWRAQLVPPMLFGMTIAIAYSRDAALLLTAAVTTMIVLAIGPGLTAWLLLMGVTAATILMLGKIRSRSKLIKVGAMAGCVAFLLTLCLGVLNNQPLAWELVQNAFRNALCAVAAGFLVTGLLPFIESLFGVLTDISLLELGDVAHPLLRELMRRAPGTYNHSVNVASLAETAADEIGANGLLVRVGAYFHDIGKMLKPAYFIENTNLAAEEANRHETLVPAMSTLIIIAHIKDGADLARQHHLPPSIIDFIEQHHGTTLVEYFYRRASQQKESDPDGANVEESSFRYPGPKPQSKEAGVLMLADAVESASRVLVEPTPARIEGLVEELALARLHDGQFDDSGLDLKELRVIQDCLIKSLIAMYHGRVKYPTQEAAERGSDQDQRSA